MQNLVPHRRFNVQRILLVNGKFFARLTKSSTSYGSYLRAIRSSIIISENVN
jgi:hypothetical protein